MRELSLTQLYRENNTHAKYLSAFLMRAAMTDFPSHEKKV